MLITAAMQVKKYPKADLNSYQGLFFVLGLAVSLFITWRALEYKSYPSDSRPLIQIEQIEDLNEDQPQIETVVIPPPPNVPAAPEIITIVEDLKEVEESVIQSTESNQEAIVEERTISADEIVLEEEDEEISIPFAVIEDAPVFPGCEGLSKADRKTCFNQKVQEHVKANFKYPEVALELGIQGKVYVQFSINPQGYIEDIRTRGPDKTLENEARRIIASLPKMTPGQQRGRNVRVPYSLPINFKMM